MMTQEEYVRDAIGLLSQLIATPSTSRNEKDAADIMEKALRNYGFTPHREANNVWVIDPHFDEQKPTLLLNAHIDTVKPVDSWRRDPFAPTIEGDTLYGLGSNDCGGGLCSLLQAFRMLTEKTTELQPYLFSIGRRGSIWKRRHQPSLASLAKNRPGYCG